ncbi:MAG TPA: hypothetical protein VGS22_25290 [Thermoanaerobaculia bacterium]|jgi:hypothetical protein|nr:hypothetical protein [Thermoanaerobaculia bacterium]
MSKNRFLVALVALLALGTLGLAEIASACDQQCQIVTPPFCRRCVDTGTYNGQTCKNSGSCGCVYTQNTCGLFAATEPAAAPDFLVAATATSGEAAVSFDLNLAFAGQ